MKKEKVMTKYKSINLKEVVVFLLLILFFMSGVLIASSMNKYDTCIMIPDSSMIDMFCEVHGYHNGWLSSSSCGVNEVQCHKKMEDGANYYECLEFEITDLLK